MKNLLSETGEHRLTLDGDEGDVEAIFLSPSKPELNIIALIAHPHPLHGGSMQNKVVTTIARSLRDLGIASLRFNFRGVGASSGQFDSGIGESNDMLKLAKTLKQEFRGYKLILAGFSFGSYVSYRVASQIEHDLLISIAPSVENFDYSEFSKQIKPWLIVMGDKDEVVSFPKAKEFALISPSKPEFEVFKDTGHFFHSKLTDLKFSLQSYIKDKLFL